MIRHFSHIVLTLGRTFTRNLLLKGPGRAETATGRAVPPTGQTRSLSSCRHLARGSPKGEHPRLAAGDGDGVLTVRGERAVVSVDRPAVITSAHLPAAGRDHRLDRAHQPLGQPPATPRRP